MREAAKCRHKCDLCQTEVVIDEDDSSCSTELDDELDGWAYGLRLPEINSDGRLIGLGTFDVCDQCLATIHLSIMACVPPGTRHDWVEEIIEHEPAAAALQRHRWEEG